MGTVTVRAFLETRDLDDLAHLKARLGSPNAADVSLIRSTLLEWRNGQAVANLLFHPSLIPVDVRLKSILRGLDETVQRYYVLAAVAGLSDIETATLTTEEVRMVRHRLLRIIGSDNSIIAARASVSIHSFLAKPDAGAVVKLLNHQNQTVRHNLLAWLVKTFHPLEFEALQSLIESSELSAQTKRDVIGQLTGHVKAQREGRFTAVGSP